jgi:quinol-cytochrome oxidoreductase complex cytochrome b subunit/cytochrome c
MNAPARPGSWDERTGWTLLKQVLFLEPLPGGSRWAAAFGSLLLFSFVLQVVTGILLAMNYAPSADTAWVSVQFIQNEVFLGDLIRALHHWGSSAMVILLLVHLVQVFVWGAYKKPRELTWMVGVLLLFCTLGLAFTGYLLPWDQKAYWATRVGLGMASTIPVVGDRLRELLQGGTQMGNLTLTRFFTLHGFVLPGLVILLVIVHLYLFRLHGVTPAWWQSAEELKAYEEPFWPKQALKDGVLALAFLIGLGLWSHHYSAPLEAQADPARPYEARPEWYFMFLFQLLRYFHGPWEMFGTFVLPLVIFLALFFWPFLDRNPHRDPRRRPVAMGLLGGGVAGLWGLTIVAIATDVRMQEPELAKAPDAPEAAGPIQRADVARIYHAECAACHGVNGSGQRLRAGMPTLPDFTSMAWQMSQTDLEIAHRIQEGSVPLMPAYRDKLPPRHILALTIYVRAFAAEPQADPASDPASAKPARPAPEVAAQMPPEQVYRAYCLACHDTDGRGALVRKAMPDMPDLADVKFWQGTGVAQRCADSILKGKGKFMVPMADKLGRGDAERLVGYLKKFAQDKQVVAVGPKPSTPAKDLTEPGLLPDLKATPMTLDAAARLGAAADLYRQYCLTCHGSDGKGRDLKSVMPSIPDFSSAAWQKQTSTAQIMVGILEGKGSLMPSFRGRVGEDQAPDLAAYLRALGPADSTPGSPAPASEFERRFRALQEQWDQLQRQLKELKRPAN